MAASRQLIRTNCSQAIKFPQIIFLEVLSRRECWPKFAQKMHKSVSPNSTSKTKKIFPFPFHPLFGYETSVPRFPAQRMKRLIKIIIYENPTIFAAPCARTHSQQNSAFGIHMGTWHCDMTKVGPFARRCHLSCRSILIEHLQIQFASHGNGFWHIDKHVFAYHVPMLMCDCL